MNRIKICSSMIMFACSIAVIGLATQSFADEGPHCAKNSAYSNCAPAQPAWKRAIDKVLRKKCPTYYRPQGLPPYSGFYGFHSTHWMRPFCAEEFVEPIAPQPIPTVDAIPAIPPASPMKNGESAAPPQPSGPLKSKSDDYNPVPKASKNE